VNIRIVRDVLKTRVKHLEDGTKVKEEYLHSQKILKREISELRDFEELLGSKGQKLRKRCIVYTEHGPVLAAHTFTELEEMKKTQFRRNAAGFTI
jgi:hypothetical protein